MDNIIKFKINKKGEIYMEDYIVIKTKEIKRETEKAFMVVLDEDGYEGKETWFPKSQAVISEEDTGNGIKEKVLLSSQWIWNKKKEELNNA